LEEACAVTLSCHVTRAGRGNEYNEGGKRDDEENEVCFGYDDRRSVAKEAKVYAVDFEIAVEDNKPGRFVEPRRKLIKGHRAIAIGIACSEDMASFDFCGFGVKDCPVMKLWGKRRIVNDS